MPEHKPFNTLADEFNAACGNWVEGKLSSAALVTRYALLMRHCSEDDEQKRQLTEKFFDTALVMLSKPLDLGPYQSLGGGYKDHMCNALDALSHESAIGHLTRHAPRDLANVALAVLAHADACKLDAEFKATFHDYAAMMLGYADRFAKSIATTKPITLKQKPAAAQ